MNVVSFNERSCEKYRRYFDAYLDNELLVETNQEVLNHLASCAECNRILQDRARLKQIVRQTVKAEAAPPELIAAVRNQVHRRGSFFSSNVVRLVLAAAACLVLAIGGIQAVRWATPVRMAYNNSVVSLLRVGLVDHIHCAILAGNWKHFVPFEAMKTQTGPQALGPQFIDLVPAVEAKLGSQYQLVQGHRCVANNRQYVHLILTNTKGIILSVVITEKNNESFTKADAVAVIQASGIPIYQDQQGSDQIAGFESDKYLAYVVSNLDSQSNLNAASLLAPVVYSHLHRLEL